MQTRFFAVVAGGGPVGAALASLTSRDPGAVPLWQWIDGDETRAVARMGAYSAMYFGRLHDTLQQQFPCLRRVLGNAAFERLSAKYLLAHPSRSPSLRHLGARLPLFLAESDGNERPDVVDLAKLEWARVEVFDEAEAHSLTPAALAALCPEDWSALRLRAIHGLRIVELAFSVDELWYAADRSQSLPPPAPGPQTMLAFRRDHVVLHRRSTAAEAAALASLRIGCGLETLCASFAASATDLDEAAQAAFAALWQWAADGLLERDR